MFNLYITDDARELQDTALLKGLPPGWPLIRIIDPAKRVPIEQIKVTRSILDKEPSNEDKKPQAAQGSYPFMQDIEFM